MPGIVKELSATGQHLFNLWHLPQGPHACNVVFFWLPIFRDVDFSFLCVMIKLSACQAETDWYVHNTRGPSFADISICRNHLSYDSFAPDLLFLLLLLLLLLLQAAIIFLLSSLLSYVLCFTCFVLSSLSITGPTDISYIHHNHHHDTREIHFSSRFSTSCWECQM